MPIEFTKPTTADLPKVLISFLKLVIWYSLLSKIIEIVWYLILFLLTLIFLSLIFFINELISILMTKSISFTG